MKQRKYLPPYRNEIVAINAWLKAGWRGGVLSYSLAALWRRQSSGGMARRNGGIAAGLVSAALVWLRRLFGLACCRAVAAVGVSAVQRNGSMLSQYRLSLSRQLWRLNPAVDTAR